MDKMAPIGVFDSGYGGLTVLKSIVEELPQYDYLYLGDNARAPYGSRSFEVVYQYTLQAVKELFGRGCNLVILACNTASAKALRTIQQNDLPEIAPDKRVLGVIRPSAELVGSLSKTGHVGILATEGTVKSGSYQIELENFSPGIHVTQHACPIWVPLIENHLHDTPAGRQLIADDIRIIGELDPQLDVLLLGCTHYPIVKDYIESLLPSTIQVIAQGQIIADKLKDYLYRHPEMDQQCSKNGTIEFLTTENSDEFNKNASVFFETDVRSSQIKLQ